MNHEFISLFVAGKGIPSAIHWCRSAYISWSRQPWSSLVNYQPLGILWIFFVQSQ